MGETDKSSVKKWQKVASRVIFEHPRLTLREDDVRLPTGKLIKYLRHENKGNGGVILICINDGKILLQREYSYPVNEVLYQFPGGRIEEGETFDEAARRELAEESRLAAGSQTYLGWFYPDNRRTNAKLHVVYCENIQGTAEGIADDEEFIESIWLPLVDFEKKLGDGEMTNYAVLAAWALFIAKYSR